jgi:biotin transport system permease protein
MAELAAFNFRPGGSSVHRLDARIKIACVVMISLSAVRAAPLELVLLSLLIGGAMVRAGISVRSFIRTSRIFFLLLIVVFFARALAVGQETTDGLTIFGIISMTRRGFGEGAVICWRLMIVVVTGFVFSATSRPAEIKAGVQWYLTPMPLVPEKRVALMLGLIVRFVPRMFRQASEVLDAQRSRCVDKRKNPVYRAKNFVIPLARKTFEDADRLAVAMEARCYREDRTDPELSASLSDWIAMIGVSVIFALILAG